MNIAVGLVIATAVFLLLLVVVLVRGKSLASESERKGRALVKYGGLILSMFYCCALFWFGCTYALAWMHGNRDPWLDIPTMERYTSRTPMEDKLPVNLEGCVVVYYRYNCRTCHDIYEDLEKALQGESNVYHVCTRSEQGEKLRETYEVPEVPYGIYIPRNEGESVVKVPLSRTDENGSTALDKQNLKILLDNVKAVTMTSDQ